MCSHNSSRFGFRQHIDPDIKECFHLPGVQFTSEKTLTIYSSNKDQSWEWKGHGLKIHIPPGALPESESKCEIAIAASLSGNFQFPEKHTLVSPVFYIQPNIQLEKPITVEMEHCCSLKTEDDTQALALVYAETSTKQPPYAFQRHNAVFTVNNNWGSFNVTKFSLFAFVWSWLRGFMRNCLYCGHIYQKSSKNLRVSIKLVVTRQLRGFYKVSS